MPPLSGAHPLAVHGAQPGAVDAAARHRHRDAEACGDLGQRSSCFRQPEHETHLTIDDFRLCIDGKSTGAVRVSLGMVSNVEDVDRFIAFAKGFIA